MKQLITLTALLLLTGSTYAQQTPNYVPTNGLVGWWPFNGNANDESGNGNNGTVNGATLTTDRFGNTDAAYDFDGNDIIETLDIDAIDGAIEMAWSCWIEWEGAYASNASVAKVIAKENPGDQINRMHLKVDADATSPPSANNLTFLMHDGSQQFQHGATDPLQPNTLSHVVMTYNGNGQTNEDKMKVYLNGNQLTNLAFTGNLPSATPSNNRIVAFGRQFIGTIDDIGIWNRALTEEEITGLYNGQCVAPTQVSLTGLSSSYNLNDGTAQLSASPGGGVFFGAGVSGNTFSPASAGVGTHSVVYTYVDADGCVASTGLCTTVDLNVNIGDSNIGTDGSIDVYPNPSNGQFVLEIQDLEGIISCTVYDTRGREVYYGSMVASGSTIRHSIDLSNETNGIYTLQMQTPTATVTRKLVKE